MFDDTLPKHLKDLQIWFGRVISSPIKDNNKLDMVSNGYILPGPILSAHERLEIYHQQYWWRLIETLQETFPTVTRLFGFKEFRAKIAVPYLHAFPSDHFLLSTLGNKLSYFLENFYHESDKNLIQTIAQIDWAINESFFALSKATVSILNDFDHPLELQPHIHLFSLDADYFTFREELNKNPIDFYNTKPFPNLLKNATHAIVYRNQESCVSWKKISEGEFLLLHLIKQGSTLAAACNQLEETPFYTTAEKEISVWLYEWISKDWIVN